MTGQRAATASYYSLPYSLPTTASYDSLLLMSRFRIPHRELMVSNTGGPTAVEEKQSALQTPSYGRPLQASAARAGPKVALGFRGRWG
jgi:hypothetical protein